MGTFQQSRYRLRGPHTAQIQLTLSPQYRLGQQARFSRQRAIPHALPAERSYGFPGAGLIAAVERLRDPFLTLPTATRWPTENASLQAQFFSRVEDLPRTQRGRLRRRSTPSSTRSTTSRTTSRHPDPRRHDHAGRIPAPTSRVRPQPGGLRTAANEDVRALVPAITPPQQIVTQLRYPHARNRRQPANDLRDDRDVEPTSSRATSPSTMRTEDGQVDAHQRRAARGWAKLRALETFPAGPSIRTGPTSQAPANTGTLVTSPTASWRAPASAMSCCRLVERNDRLPPIHRGINAIHSRGNGLRYLDGPIESTNAVTDPALSLNALLPAFPVRDGPRPAVYDNTLLPRR